MSIGELFSGNKQESIKIFNFNKIKKWFESRKRCVINTGQDREIDVRVFRAGIGNTRFFTISFCRILVLFFEPSEKKKRNKKVNAQIIASFEIQRLP